MMTLRIQLADLDDTSHASAVVELIDGYARGPGGQNAPLDDAARGALTAGLRDHPMAHVFLAWRGDRAVGVAVCVQGFSTFAGRASLNIHDLAVADTFQGQGIGEALLDHVVADARTRGCCKVTLEVHDSNARAKRLYERKGFGPWSPATFFVTRPL